MTEEKILARVRKMLTLANDAAASEGERDNALRMAHNLLTKYQLDMSDVDAHIREREDPRGHFVTDGWFMPWCKDIRHAVAKLFMCSYYYGRKINATRGRHHFVGRESNATTAMLLSEFIVQSVLKEADRRYKHRLTPEGRSFAMGVASQLWVRIRELTKEAEAQVGEGRALVLVEMAKTEANENDAFIKAEGTALVTKKARRDNKVKWDAYVAGDAFGKTVSLNTQMGVKKAAGAIK